MPQETLPNWLTGVSKTERLAHERYAALSEQHRQLTQELERARTAFEEASNWKRLLHEAGGPLEERVAKALELFGFAVAAGPQHDCIVGTAGSASMVVVAKGVNDSATEIHAMQLEKCVSDYGLAQGRLPKGLLVVTAFRARPLDERTVPTFPQQMLDYSTLRKHCLVTGVQFFAMVSEVLEDPRKTSAVREVLLNTVGTVKGYDDVTNFLTTDQEMQRVKQMT
jgi:hypothetical protein